jgi:molybdopterin-guanine dinucleotide biosynthesis protein A
MHALTAVILAGGAGTRVGGRDKGLIEQGGVPLVEHVRSRLAPQVGRIVISANRNAERYARYGERVLADASAGYAGPLAGIAAALMLSESEWIITVPVDALEFPDDLCARLVQAERDEDTLVTVAHDGARRQPLFALYHRSLANAALAAAAGPDAAVWRFQDAQGAVEVRFAGARFANYNLAEES